MPNKTLKPVDLSKKLKPYENKWVALSLDHKKILGAGDSLEEAKRKAEKKAKIIFFLNCHPLRSAMCPLFGHEISLSKNSDL